MRSARAEQFPDHATIARPSTDGRGVEGHPNAPAFLSISDLAGPSEALQIPSEAMEVYQLLAGWITSYLAKSHATLGRPGDVCPYTAHAVRLDTIRVAVSLSPLADDAEIRKLVLAGIDEFHRIPSTRTTAQFRAVLMGFPNLAGTRGEQALEVAQKRLRFYSLRRGIMIGRFHASAPEPGLWNPTFRPFRSPLPILAVRELVEADAPFVLRHPLLLPKYLMSFPRQAPRRIFTQVKKKLARRTT